MANGIDPRISLAAQPIDLANLFAKNQVNEARRAAITQQREQAPFQNQLLQLQAELGQAQQPSQLQIAEEAASPLAQLNRRDQARLQSVVQGAQELSPLLESNDIAGARSQLIARKARLTKLGLPTETTDESLELLETNPDLLRQRVTQAVELGRQSGFIQPTKAISQTASQKDFDEFQRLQTIAQSTGRPEDQQAAQQFGAQAGFVRQTPQQEAALKVETSRQIETEKSQLTGKSAAVKSAINKGAKAFDQIAPISTAISNYDDAIAQLDAGASTGFFASLAPSFKAASIKLDNTVKRLGLDVVGNTTFGALSESELKFALQAAIPTNLQPAELKEWLIAKRDAQKKVKERVEEAASFLSDGTHTLKDWINFDQARQLNIKNQQQQQQVPPESIRRPQPSAAQPTAQQPAAGVQQIGRFTVEIIE